MRAAPGGVGAELFDPDTVMSAWVRASGLAVHRDAVRFLFTQVSVQSTHKPTRKPTNRLGN